MSSRTRYRTPAPTTEYIRQFDLVVASRTVRELGSSEAVMLAYIQRVGQTADKEWFTVPMKSVYLDLGIPVVTQKNILRKLVSKGLIDCRRIGFPARRVVLWREEWRRR